jgi:hypothetical protein
MGANVRTWYIRNTHTHVHNQRCDLHSQMIDGKKEPRLNFNQIEMVDKMFPENT